MKKYTAGNKPQDKKAASEQQAHIREEATHSRTKMVLWLDIDCLCCVLLCFCI